MLFSCYWSMVAIRFDFTLDESNTMKTVAKQKRLNSADTSSTFHRSISAYGKNQKRFLNDIPCSNWLPFDDSLGKTRDIFTDVATSFNKGEDIFPPGKSIGGNQLFDSDSENDDFLAPTGRKIQKFTRKLHCKRQTKPREAKRNIKTKKPSKAKNENLDLVKPVRGHLAPEKNIDAENIPPFNVAKNISDNLGISAAREFEISTDMFTGYKMCDASAAITNDKSALSANVVASPVIVQRKDFSVAGTRKSILKPISKSSLLEDKPLDSFIGNVSASSKNRVNFNSTVLYHAPNIEMSETVPQKFLLGNNNFRLQSSTPVVMKSIPLVGQELRLKVADSNPLKDGVDVPEQPTSNCPVNNVNLQSGNSAEKLVHADCDDILRTNVHSVCIIEKPTPATGLNREKVARKKQSKKKKVPVWKKGGGISFSRKNKTVTYGNGSILHQIMTGTFDPKCDFLEDSTDVYFVNSNFDDTVNLKLTNFDRQPAKMAIKKTTAPFKEQAKKTAMRRNQSAGEKQIAKNPVISDDNKYDTIDINKQKSDAAHQTGGSETDKSNEHKNPNCNIMVATLTKNRKRPQVSACESKISIPQEEIFVETNLCTERPQRTLRTKQLANHRLMLSDMHEDTKLMGKQKVTQIGSATEIPHKSPPEAMKIVAHWTRRKPRQTWLYGSSDGSNSSFSSLSFCSSKLSPDSCINKSEQTGKSENIGRKDRILSEFHVPVKRNLRAKKRINYKDLSNGYLLKDAKMGYGEAVTKIPDSSTSESANGSGELANCLLSVHEELKCRPGDTSENASDVLKVSESFICTRAKRKQKIIPMVSCKESPLFSSLSFNSEKKCPVSSVPTHVNSTINRSNSDDEKHGDRSGDRTVNSNITASKGLSAPVMLRSPVKHARMHFSILQNQSHSDAARENVDNFSPIPTTSTEESLKFHVDGSPRPLSPPSLAQPMPCNRITHPRIAILIGSQRKISTPNSSKLSNMSGLGESSSSYGVTSLTVQKITTPLRRRVRSPGSHLSSSIVHVEKTRNSICEIRRRTLDSVRTNLSCAFQESEEQNENEMTPRLSTTRKESLPGSDAKVLVTPMRMSFVQQLLSSGNKIKLKSLGLVDALTPNRATFEDGRALTPREKVLYECDQLTPMSFEQVLQGVITERCIKLGEGLYGEVFRCNYASRHDSVAVKIIPIGGSLIVNNEPQKSFEEALPEIISSKELHILSHGKDNATVGFVKLHNVSCVKGKYPDLLLNAWNTYDEEKTSDNDRPDQFTDDQLYLLFQYADGGMDAQHFKFRSAAQAFSVLQQVCVSLAVAEECLKFEHRDLHWGNILVSQTTENTVSATLCGREFTIATHGVKANIIDFTLSRLSKDGVTVFQNLAADPELFAMDSDEDYQFEIYRMMKQATRNRWSTFQPKTNIFWLHYLSDKFCKEVKFTHQKSRLHTRFFTKLKKLDENILQHNSCIDAVLSSVLFSPDTIS